MMEAVEKPPQRVEAIFWLLIREGEVRLIPETSGTGCKSPVHLLVAKGVACRVTVYDLFPPLFRLLRTSGGLLYLVALTVRP